MAALTADRALIQVADLESRNRPLAASTKVYAGGLVALNTSGYAVPASADATLVVDGVAMEQIDNSSGSAGDLNVEVRAGLFWFSNSSAADEITAGDEGDLCYAADDQTVAKTSSSSTRPVAGRVVDVDSSKGVLVYVGWADLAGQSQQYVTCSVKIPDISTADTVWVAPGLAGEVVLITSVISNAITVGDATLTCDINTTAITGGGITVANAGSAAGDVDQATPTAANVITATDALSVETDGGSTTACECVVTFLIRTN